MKKRGKGRISKRRMNKRGWLLIVEAVMAVLILFGFVFATISKQASEVKTLKEEPSLYDVANVLILKAQENETIRNYILANDEINVNSSLKSELIKINPSISLDIDIKEINEICSLTLKEKEIYAADNIIGSSSTLNLYRPQKLCVFVWQE